MLSRCEASRSLFKKAAQGGNAGLWPADPSLAHSLEHPTAACQRSVIHADQTCPQFCGSCMSLILNELCLELVSQRREIWGTRRLKLDRVTLFYSGHKPACKRATTRCSRAMKNSRPPSKRAAQLGAMYLSITLIPSSPLIFRPGSTKCDVGAMSRAPMMPENHHSSRGRRL